MAKDGTARGGARIGSGRKSKALTEKIETGNPGGRKLKVIQLPKGAYLKGEDIPDPKEYLNAKQKNGELLGADEIFKNTWKWIKERGCDQLISTQLVVSKLFQSIASLLSIRQRELPARHHMSR